MSTRLKLLSNFVQLVSSDVTAEIHPRYPNNQTGHENGHTHAKLEFHRLGRRVLKAVAEEMGLASGSYDIRSNLAGPAVSGEVTLHGEHIYISFAQGCLKDMFMFRSCRDRKDSTGGSNQWMLWDGLLDISRACETFKRVAQGL